MMSPGTSESAAPEVPLWRLNVLRVIALLFALSNLVKFPEMLLYASATDRGMIKAFLTGLWLMSFLAVRYPLKMLPLFLFEFTWKAVWLLAFGLPQWFSGIGSPQLGRDLIEIGLTPIVLAFLIPWPYFWRHYFREPSEPWRRPAGAA